MINILTIFYFFIRQLQCCGVDGPRDWVSGYSITNRAGSQGSFPTSCCNDTQTICQTYNAYQEGCFSKLEMRVQNGATVLIGVGIGIAFVEASKILIYTKYFIDCTRYYIRHVVTMSTFYCNIRKTGFKQRKLNKYKKVLNLKIIQFFIKYINTINNILKFKFNHRVTMAIFEFKQMYFLFLDCRYCPCLLPRHGREKGK